MIAPTQLRAFVDEHFPPDKNLVTMVNRLARCLGRKPTIADVSEQKFERFANWLKQHYAPKSAENSQIGFRQIWRELLRHGGAPPAPPDRRGRPYSLWPKAVIEPCDKANPPTTLRQLYVYFYEPLRLRGKSEKGKTQYRVNIDHFAKFLKREPLLTDLTDEVAGEFFAWMVETGRSPVTANKARNHILALWRLAARKRFVEEFPAVPRLTEPKRVPRARTREELDRLWQAFESEKGQLCGIPARLWFAALHDVMWFSGERIGAILQLRWVDIDLATGWLIVPAEARKFGNEDKPTKPPANAIEALRRIQEPKRDRIFPLPFTEPTLYKRYGAILKRAGLAHQRQKFHAIRRSTASHYKAAGGDAMALLGHSSSKVTAVYLDPRIAIPPQAADLLFAPGTDHQRKGGAA